ncbi:hypothetical protein V2J09_022950 [Rumex salicifolius]
MPSSAATTTLLRRARPSIHRLSDSIQRLTSFRQFSSTTEQVGGIEGDGHQQSPSSETTPKNRSIPRWIAGVSLGSAIGVLYHHYFNGGVEIDDSNIFDPYQNRGLCVAFADWPSAPTAEAVTASNSADSFSDKKTKFLFGDAYRRKVFFNYEKRIRLRSPPEKVYAYFATFINSDGEVLMTPADLMRAVVPVFPPSESNLVRDGYLRGEKKPEGELRCPPSEFFMLFDVDTDGLISFKEYIFFVTLLSIPESSFSVAFKMFDIDNNGEIDREEFKKVMALMRSANRQGAAQRDGLRAGTKIGNFVENGGLVEYFFGKDGTGKLQHDKFVKFLRDLHDEMLRLEFAHYDYLAQGSISAKDFALSMIASADINHINKLLDRAGEIDRDPHLSMLRITEDEFRMFAELRKKLEPFSWALFSFGKISGLLTKADFQRAALQVCNVQLSENLVDIVFHVFDANRDGSLSVDEFLRVLERREKDIAGTHVDDGIFSWLFCCWSCAKSRSSVSRCSLNKKKSISQKKKKEIIADVARRVWQSSLILLFLYVLLPLKRRHQQPGFDKLRFTPTIKSSGEL